MIMLACYFLNIPALEEINQRDLAVPLNIYTASIYMTESLLKITLSHRFQDHIKHVYLQHVCMCTYSS